MKILIWTGRKNRTAVGAENTELKGEKWLSFFALCALRPLRLKSLPSYFPDCALLLLSPLPGFMPS